MEHHKTVDPEDFNCPRCGKQDAMEPIPGTQEKEWICFHCDKPFKVITQIVWDDEAKKFNYWENLLGKENLSKIPQK